MNLYINVTDWSWFEFLRNNQPYEEVNFWKPSEVNFTILSPGELFLFKLHSPKNVIVGGSIFAHYSLVPISLAWEAFQQCNGSPDFTDMRRKVLQYRKTEDTISDFKIGCILLQQPFFLPEDKWIPAPSDWGPYPGKHYDLSSDKGKHLLKWASEYCPTYVQRARISEPLVRYGQPLQVFPRLGQGSFRVVVTDAYERRCAISNERTLPALDAAHIKPYPDCGEHSVNNGILLRKDLHALFDKGYLTITPELKIEVSNRIREEFENGRDYYKYHGNEIRLPNNQMYLPSQEFITWHNDHIYRI